MEHQKILRTIKLITFLAPIFLSGCIDIKNLEYVPASEEIKQLFPEFLSKPTEIQGIYGNRDVDARLFMYQTEDRDLFTTIEKTAKETKWILRKNTSVELEFYKNHKSGVPITGPIRIGYQSEGQRVCVGSFSHGDEKWASKYFWPKYEACIKGASLTEENNQ